MLVINFIGLIFFSLIFPRVFAEIIRQTTPTLHKSNRVFLNSDRSTSIKQSEKFHFPHSVIKQVGLLNMLWLMRMEKFMSPYLGLQ